MTTRQRLSPKEGFPNDLFISKGRFLRDAQHIPYSVVACLAELGQTDWIPRVFSFLAMYDGVASWSDVGMPEAACMADLDLSEEVQRRREHPSAVQEDPAALRFRLAVKMANLPITRFGATWKLARRYKDVPMEITWDPLQQPWLAFLWRNTSLPDHATLHISRKARYNQQQLVAYLLER